MSRPMGRRRRENFPELIHKQLEEIHKHELIHKIGWRTPESINLKHVN